MAGSLSSAIFNVLKYSGMASLAVTLIALGFLYKYQKTLVYPSAFPQGSRENVPTPKEFNMEYERIELRTRDKVTLDSYLMLQSESPESRPTLLYFHANAGNMGHRLPIARVFYSALNMNVFIISYRGYGKSTGSPSEAGLKIDSQTALEYLMEHPICSKTKIVVYGQSIGGAVAIALTAKNQDRISALILENTFTSIKDMIPTVFPYGGSIISRFCTEIWSSQDEIRKIKKLPVLFLSGEKDEIVPPPQMVLLFGLCGSAKKKFHSFPKCTHNDTCLGDGYFQVIADFLAENDINTPAS
ncbi:palmitoyl-(protein) hydrolase [Schizosaccharomyces pombe]|uniref:Protein bem46 n=1 Tax=Schizosaccharomyces pombe (strain 972 / ATCC 24843) TaxID=284812 RepID=BEM46_SCHPO|nr:putative esterase/lipase [Schizosaccharomyces pombe]P54069.3 RecName: Full=Protein bem46 [Schizosaccharomyces pombe 972h-]CAC37493.1 esterase/lipase (predicted) [Schizosaccharomyces pombe]|eukprot:NP_595609.1 putative esterase/lipase [Schizosaccharomyces pombe]